MAAVRFSAPPQIPGLPFQHPQREPLRQIAEDYGLSQGPHWERSEGLSSAGWMESTHLLCRIPAGRGPVQAREAEAAFSFVFQFGVRLQREQKLTHSPPQKHTERREKKRGSAGASEGASVGQAHLCCSRELWDRGLKPSLGYKTV